MHAKDSFQLRKAVGVWCIFILSDCIDKMKSVFHSSEILAVMFSVSITIPLGQVDGPSILEVLTGALLLLHKESIACRLSEYSFVLGEPAEKNLDN